jgi:putative thioredoxin
MSTFTGRRSNDAARRGFAASRSWGGGRAFASAASSSSPPPPPAPDDDAGLPPVVEIEDPAQLQDIVTRATQGDIGLVFDFYAQWCGPCKTLTPLLEDAVIKAPRKLNADGTHSLPSVVLVKIDVDKHAGISDELRITSLPTTMTMRDGKLVDTVVGAMSPAEAEALVAKAAAPSDDQKSSSSHETNTNTNPAAPPSPADLVDRAFALLDAPSASESAAAAAADLLNAALASESALPPAAKARAYAAAARCALLARPPDVPGARAMVASARLAVGGNFPEPEAIATAEARASLTELALDARDAFFKDWKDAKNFPASDAFAARLEEIETEKVSSVGDDDDESQRQTNVLNVLFLTRSLAAVLALEGDAAGAVAAALAATKRSLRFGDDGDKKKARETCVAVFDAFGQKHPESVAGKRKLANVWFV